MARAGIVGPGSLAALFVASWAFSQGCHRPPDDSSRVENPSVSRPVAGPLATGRGRPAVAPSPETLDLARRSLSDSQTPGGKPTESACGPYLALSSAPPEYAEICDRLARQADARYQARFGVTLEHPGKGLVLVFGSADGFRRFAAALSGLSPGYSGFTLASRGVVAVSAEGVSQERFASVLTHELAHMLHRRAFGPNLAPWLSEGLADALGSTALPGGFTELDDLRGVEPMARRLRQALGDGRLASATSVIDKSRSTFDREPVSFDYEASALLVRFLLLDPELNSRFHAALRRLAEPAGCDKRCLLEELLSSETDLERRFRAWLGRNRTAQP